MTGFLAVLASVGALFVPSGDADVVVTRDTLSLPAGCSVTETAALITEFLDVFNRGDTDELDRLFAPAGEGREDFKWYSADEGGRARAVYERERLLDYFRERHRLGETMQLVSLDLGPARLGSVGFSYALLRRADDLPGDLARGKGQLDCGKRRINVWSMGQSPATTSTCPTPDGWEPGQPVLACSRGPNARAVVPAFVPPRIGCRATAFRGARALLTAFNLGLGPSVRARLAPRATFGPAGRSSIEAFVAHRYRRLGEGWTLTRLSALPGGGRFALTLAVSRLGAPAGRGTARIAVECKTGLIRAWSGPVVRLH